MDLKHFKNLIENHPVGLATVTEENKPNVIGVAYVKIVSDDEVLVTDNYMNQTLKDISVNPNVCLIVWDKDLNGCKLVGTVEHYMEGKWKKFVEGMEENNGLPAKGALLIKVTKIIPSR